MGGAQEIQKHLDRRERHRAFMYERMRAYTGIVAMVIMVVVMIVAIVMVMMVIVVTIMIMRRLFTQPAPHVGALGFRVVEPAIEQRRRTGIGTAENQRARVDLPQSRPQAID